ncbi:MAG TPA: hypothetical protein VFX15_14365, partial [Actinomycetes bacterium]|nr:hypothetical protein [Actinomycetes bacterium]
MTAVPGPGDPDDRDEFGDPKSVDAAFDEIVANLDQPQAPDAPWPDAENDGDAGALPPQEGAARTPRQEWPGWEDVRVPSDETQDAEVDETDEEADGDSDEGHYVPPPPPPVPRG